MCSFKECSDLFARVCIYLEISLILLGLVFKLCLGKCRRAFPHGLVWHYPYGVAFIEALLSALGIQEVYPLRLVRTIMCRLRYFSSLQLSSNYSFPSIVVSPGLWSLTFTCHGLLFGENLRVSLFRLLELFIVYSSTQI